MRKERFPSKHKSKIMPRFDNPFKILEQIGPNAYKLNLPGDYGVSTTFNVADLGPYFDEEEEMPSLRSNSNQPGEDEWGHPSKPLEALPSGPMQVKKSAMIKEGEVMVRNTLDNLDSWLGYLSEKCPDFICLVELNPKEEISCMHDLLQA